MEDRRTIRRLNKGAGRNVYSPQFDAAAVEMRVLRWQLTGGEYAGTTESAQRVLTLLGREISLHVMEVVGELTDGNPARTTCG